MHTALYRANALLTYAGTALAILAALASLTGVLVPVPAPAPLTATLNARADLWHKEAPVVDVRLAKVERLHALENSRGGRDDEARQSPPCPPTALPALSSTAPRRRIWPSRFRRTCAACSAGTRSSCSSISSPSTRRR